MEKIFINGKWEEGSSNQKIKIENPATKEIFAEVPKGNIEDADKALEAAKESFQDWKRSSPQERSVILRKAADICENSLPDFAETLTREQGKPLSEAKGEINAAIKALKYYSRKALDIDGEIISTNDQNVRSLVIKQPVGPVVAIGPWNYPILLIFWKIAPALAAGCTLVVKPPSQTPLSVIKLIRYLERAGVPPGVLNLVTGPGKEIGGALVEHPATTKIAFTGQTQTGRIIMKSAASQVKRLTLELGGHCPLIVSSDADIEEVADAGVYRSFRNMGQICNSVNRIYVEKEIYEDFREAFIENTKKLVIADGLKNPDADLGPMIDEGAREKTRKHIQDAIDKGAKLECGGQEPEGEKYEKGYFFEPTVLTNVNHDMIVMIEETFGPVAHIMEVPNLDRAVKYANDSIYGLVAYLFTQDLDNGLRISEKLEYETVGINNVSGGDVPYPYAGWKQSGLGIELAEYGLEEYLLVKHIRATSL